MKLTILVEDTTKDPGLKTELGLSILIETADQKLLLDTGASPFFSENAGNLGIDLSAIDRLLISHAHYDHTGGLKTFLTKNQKAPVYISPEATGAFYVNKTAAMPQPLSALLHLLLESSRSFSKYIGMDAGLLTECQDRFRFIRSIETIDDGIWAIPHVEQIDPPAKGNRFLLELKNGKLATDRFRHELIWVVQEPDGLVVFTGCGHNGVLNMIRMIRKHLGQEKIKAVVGGFHLRSNPHKEKMADTPEVIENIGTQLIKAGVERVITGHCTGSQAYQTLKNVLGSRLEQMTCGLEFTI